MKYASINATVMSKYATREIVILARHQLEILERRFPNYEHSIHVLESPNCLIVSSYKDYLFHILFYPSSVGITLSIGDKYDDIGEDVVLDYADPKFTDDAISDIIEEWEAKHAHA